MVRQFTIGQRLTPHVRHREKYVDVPVTEGHAFVFAEGPGAGRRARTLRQFVAHVEHMPSVALEAYLKRGDFSRWIRGVFGDHALASELRAHEERYRRGDDLDIVPEVVAAIRSRYDLTEDGSDPSVHRATAAATSRPAP